MFDSLLIANRGEIALRILRACKVLGLRSIAVYSDADRGAGYLALADQSLCIGPATATQSYLDQGAIIRAARLTGAQAVHPGYGFLSENADFAQKVEEAGLHFVGPASSSIRMMGNKVAAKRAMRAAGIPCVPGPDETLPEDMEGIARLARKIGFPVIVKAAAGGGGRGMRVVSAEAELADAIAITREEARRAFGNAEVYLEKYLERPRHVEIQVIADTRGNALWLGSRDCSLQRRHQKVIEEAPAPGIDDALVSELGQQCVLACRRIDYRGVGTFEFLYQDGAFYFIEMNTRLQVEHPVTEMTSGLDIVQMQLRVARGEALDLDQSMVRCRGHAIECRINAEDPESFAPSPGLLTRWRAPGGPGVRIDSHAGTGYRVPSHYDSLIGKLIVHGVDRADAMRRMTIALEEFDVEGVKTNIPLHRKILRDAAVLSEAQDIHYLGKWLEARRIDAAGRVPAGVAK